MLNPFGKLSGIVAGDSLVLRYTVTHEPRSRPRSSTTNRAIPPCRVSWPGTTPSRAKPFKVVEYAGAKHAFTNPDADKAGVPGLEYNAKADQESWQELVLFFKQVFGPAQ